MRDGIRRAAWWLAQREYDYERSRYDPLANFRWLGSVWRYFSQAAARAATASQSPPGRRPRRRARRGHH
ncbi:MAG TPA: hypothetical protein VII06_41865 [Chloroflexota bacterium]|jgi:hypothetical protein